MTWQSKQLGEVLEIQNGFAFNSKHFSSENGVPLIRIRDLKIGKSTEINYDSDYDQRYIVKKGDLLIGMDGEFGCYQWKGADALLNQRVCRLQNFDKCLEPKFLFYGVNKYLKEIENVTAFTTVKHISSRQINSILFPLPPLPEQKRIVAILDEVFEGIAKAKQNAEKNLKNAKEVFEAILQELFVKNSSDFPEKKLGDIAEIKGGKRVPKGYKLKNQKTNHPYIRVADFNDKGSIDLDDIKYVDFDVFNQIKAYTISSKDMYMSIAGTIGKTGIVPNELDGANLTENACKLVFKPNVDKKYVYYFTKTKNFMNQAGINTRVAAMPKLALSRLSTISFFIPDRIEEQQKFVKKFDEASGQIQKLEQIYQRKLELLEELKQSVLQKAFAGEL